MDIFFLPKLFILLINWNRWNQFLTSGILKIKINNLKTKSNLPYDLLISMKPYLSNCHHRHRNIPGNGNKFQLVFISRTNLNFTIFLMKINEKWQKSKLGGAVLALNSVLFIYFMIETTKIDHVHSSISHGWNISMSKQAASPAHSKMLHWLRCHVSKPFMNVIHDQSD